MNQNQMLTALGRQPDAIAKICGSSAYPHISGCVRFYQTNYGVLISAELSGLPRCEETNGQQIFAFHIHDGSGCTGTKEDPFANTKGHYNPHNLPHPYHAGDLPPLFGNDGCAFQVFLTNRFKVHEIIGKTVLIHSNADDFTTQPSGNPGSKIACGEIRSLCNHRCDK